MTLYDAYLYDAKTREKKPLGRVRAENTPGACLRAYDKFKVPAGQQRMVGVTRVKPLPLPPPIPEEDARALRTFSRLLNETVKRSFAK